ncbi:MAG: DeoR/GlpR family DNA-binding transcription regulator [Opitutales bacterium]|nr:DeoR/GlpR family DNA-binding transcription regulator [Opitutales bacterium]
MLPAERHREIISQLDQKGSIRTIDIAKSLNVTDETIRRDLEKLEKDGLIQRTHGGAVQIQRPVKDWPFEDRVIQNIDLKKEIAREAVNLIKPNDRIFVDASSTALQMAQYLWNINLTVLTNSHLFATALFEKPNIEVLMTGGRFDPQSKSYVGPAAMATIRRYRIDKFFFSGNGIDVDRGVSEINESQAYIKETIIRRTGTSIFLADQSKLGAASSYFFASAQEVDVLITNTEADHPILETLKAEGTDIKRSQS